MVVVDGPVGPEREAELEAERAKLEAELEALERKSRESEEGR